MTNDEIKELEVRASQAFDVEFRFKLEMAVQKHVTNGGKIEGGSSSYNPNQQSDCKCPQGCLSFYNFPLPGDMVIAYGFEYNQHDSFQNGFDNEEDDGTSEAALGLLYRERFL